MRWGIVLSIVFSLFAIFLLVFYWLIPSNVAEFVMKPSNYNFSISGSSDMQFYPNLRFPSSLISYKVASDCPSAKEVEMERAFLEISGITILKFYPVNSNEEISVACSGDTQKEGNLFVAGEGGPTKVIAGKKFNVILAGKILLLRESDCSEPNIAIHELLHVLGFDHSLNPYNIMYNITNCKQTIGDDIPNLINNLYSYPSLPDLTFTNVSAVMRGIYLDVNMTIRNEGLKNSQTTLVDIYADNKMIKEFSLDAINLGEGVIISYTNILVPKLSVEKLGITINSDFEELNKENNNITLEIKT